MDTSSRVLLTVGLGLFVQLFLVTVILAQLSSIHSSISNQAERLDVIATSCVSHTSLKALMDELDSTKNQLQHISQISLDQQEIQQTLATLQSTIIQQAIKSDRVLNNFLNCTKIAPIVQPSRNPNPTPQIPISPLPAPTTPQTTSLEKIDWNFDVQAEIQQKKTLRITRDTVFADKHPTAIWRLGFPGTSSTNLRTQIVAGAELPMEKRLPANCKDENMYLVKCDNNLNYFHKYAGNITTFPDIGQHVSLGKKKNLLFSTQISKCEMCNSDISLMTVILREPAQYANRVFQDKRPTFKLAEDGTRVLLDLGVKTISDSLIFFDWTFEQRTGVSIENITIADWIDKAYWRWNYFTRGLSNDYQHSLWLRSEVEDPISLAAAELINNQGANSKLLATAIKTLDESPYFGIFDRLQESMELLAFTFCWNLEDLPFKYKAPSSISMRDTNLHVLRGSDVLDPEAWRVFQQRNQLDLLLWQYAEELFQYRLDKMALAKQAGYVCQLAQDYCGVVCL